MYKRSIQKKTMPKCVICDYGVAHGVAFGVAHVCNMCAKYSYYKHCVKCDYVTVCKVASICYECTKRVIFKPCLKCNNAVADNIAWLCRYCEFQGY